MNKKTIGYKNTKMRYQTEFMDNFTPRNIQGLREYYEKYKKHIDIHSNEEECFRNACENGFLEVAQLLYEIAPDIDISTRSEYPFRYACVNGHLNVAQWLVAIKPTINISIWNNYAFFSSCSNGHLDILRWLLEIDGSIDISYSVRLACEYGHLEVAKWLLEHRPDTNISERDEYAFRWACGNGHMDVVRFLLELKPDINMRALDEQVLFMACHNIKYKAVEFLLGARDDWSLKYLPKFLDKRMISLMNRYLFNKMKWMKTLIENTEKVDCSTCLSISEIGRKTPCGHYFCCNCITRWVVSNRTCPYCRKDVISVPA